jgi:hypothetical protein
MGCSCTLVARRIARAALSKRSPHKNIHEALDGGVPETPDGDTGLAEDQDNVTLTALAPAGNPNRNALHPGILFSTRLINRLVIFSAYGLGCALFLGVSEQVGLA